MINPNSIDLDKILETKELANQIMNDIALQSEKIDKSEKCIDNISNLNRLSEKQLNSMSSIFYRWYYWINSFLFTDTINADADGDEVKQKTITNTNDYNSNSDSHSNANCNYSQTPNILNEVSQIELVALKLSDHLDKQNEQFDRLNEKTFKQISKIKCNKKKINKI